MKDRWQNTTLGAIARDGVRGIVDGPFGSNLPASLYLPDGIPLIRGSNLSLGKEKFQDGGYVFVSEETAQSLARSLCEPDDIIFTKKGTLGQTGIVPHTSKYKRFLLSGNQMRLALDKSVADPLFVYYYVSSPASREKIIQDSDVTGVPKTNVAYLRKFPILLPPLPIQRRIADILCALDDKIECNRQMSRTLEAMAQALFTHCFVDFAPFRGGAFVDSELGEIPQEWEVCGVSDLCEFNYGKGLKETERIAGSYPVYGSAGIVGTHTEYLVQAPGIVVGRKGTIGHVHRARLPFFPIDTTYSCNV